MKAQQSGFFWPSFTDLMTSLFFVMLVLYVLTYVKLKYQQRTTFDQLKKIREIQSAVKELPKAYFAYDSVYKRFSLVRNIEFETQKDVIKPQYTEYLVNVGTAIKNLIDTLKHKYAGQDIKYVVIIEGMSSRDQYIDNYPLSYKRAQAIRVLWIQHEIRLDQSVCELQVSGSGTGGIGRYPAADDKMNQRILIQIVPKIGDVK